VATVYNSLPNFPLQKLSETIKSQVSGWLSRSNIKAGVSHNFRSIHQSKMDLTPFEEWKLQFAKSSDFELQSTITSISDLSLKTLKPQIFAKVVKVGRQLDYIYKGKPGVVQHLILSDSTGDIRISLFNEFVKKFENELKV